MVSFFGLRFGGDKKKAQNKQADKLQPQAQTQQRWQPGDPTDLADIQNIGLNFSRPQRPLSRPGTATSTMAAPSNNWRGAFKNITVTSSMVDLSASARRPSISSLRQPGAEKSGFQPWMKSNASSTSLVMPEPFGANAGPRPGTPSKPASVKGEWVNPLDVHFSKDTANSKKPDTSAAVSPSENKSPLGRFQFGIKANTPHDDLDDADDFGEPGPDVGAGRSGYPSPPDSIDATDHKSSFSPVSPVDPKNSSNALGGTNKFAPTSLPSPSPSISGTNEERLEPPVIRNVYAKRDTMAFLSPRRRSFTMAIEEADLEKHKKQQHPVEGLTGNFADFNFGEGVSKPATSSGTLGLELVESPIEMTGPNPFKEDDVAGQGMNDSRETALATPPKLLQNQQSHSNLARSMPGPTPAKTWPAPGGSVATSFKPSQGPRRNEQGAPVSTAAGGTPSNFNSSSFNRAPQGFNSRMESDSRARGPPQPLQSAPVKLVKRGDAATHSPRSPYGPAASDGNYMRNDEAPRPPGEKAPSSPFTSVPSIEGDFPVMKGLPRGRRPTRPQLHDGSAERNQNEERGENSSSLYGGLTFDRSETRHSAMPAPLSPAVRQLPPPQPNSPSWSVSTSATAPRIPSPTFPSLEMAISSTSEELARSFELAYDIPPPQLSPLGSEFSFFDPVSPNRTGSPMRVEAKKAPPRPAPITLPPSFNKDQGPSTPNSVRSPPPRPNLEVRTTFI